MARSMNVNYPIRVDGDEVAGSLTIERNAIEVPPSFLPEPDPDWTFIDAAGHAHYSDDGYPTLERVVVDTWWCADCHEHHDDEAMACRVCGERIRPGTLAPSPFSRRMPGTETWAVEVDRFYEQGTEHTIEVAGKVGTAVVVESSLSFNGTGNAIMEGISGLSETAGTEQR